jgi:hypothetical protein
MKIIQVFVDLCVNVRLLTMTLAAVHYLVVWQVLVSFG